MAANISRVVQGWSSLSPTFDRIDFVSLYIEIPVMIVMTVVWFIVRRTKTSKSSYDLPTPTQQGPDSPSHSKNVVGSRKAWWRGDLVDVDTVDLSRDEYVEVELDRAEDERQEARLRGKYGWAWRMFHWLV